MSSAERHRSNTWSKQKSVDALQQQASARKGLQEDVYSLREAASGVYDSAFDLRRILRVDSALSLIGWATPPNSACNTPPLTRSTLAARHVRKQMRLVQEADACFFENFGSLGQNLDAARRDYINKSSRRRRSSARRLSFQLSRFQKPNDQLREDLYFEVLYTIFHRVGISSQGPNDAQLFDYTNHAFTIKEERRKGLYESAKDEKPPIIILNVIVCEARDLVAKDADGFSDPFCMLGIIPGKHPNNNALHYTSRLHASLEQDSGHSSPNTTALLDTSTTASNCTSLSSASTSSGGVGFFSKVRGSFRMKTKRKGHDDPHNPKSPDEEDSHDADEGDHHAPQRRVTKADANGRTIPAKLIKATSVRPNTLQPVWNEKFQLVVDDPTADQFHLDIWDHDDEASIVDAVGRLNEVSNLRGLGRFFKQVAQSARSNSGESVDDFLGSVTIDCKDVTAKGVEQWFPLKPRTDKSTVSGEILLKMWLGTREDRMGHDEGDNMLDIQQHISIVRIFVDHEIRTRFNGDASRWTGNFSDEATQILHQHAIQGDLTDAQKALCHWIAHCWLHFYESLDYGFVHERLNALISKWEPTSLSKDEEEMLAECFSQFLQHSYQQLLMHRENFPPAEPTTSAQNVEYLLRCLTMLHECEHFKRVLPFQRELYTELVTLVQRSACQFFHRAKAAVEAKEKCETDDSYGAMAKLMTMMNAACSMAVNIYAEPFTRVAGIDYFTLTYLEFDQMLQGEICAASIAETWERKSLHDIELSSITPQQSAAVQKTMLPLFELHMSLAEFMTFRTRCDPDSGCRAQVRMFSSFYERVITKWLIFARDLLLARIEMACELDKNIEAETTEVRQSTSYVDVCYTVKQVLDFWDRLVVSNAVKRASLNERLVQTVCQALEHYAEKVFTVLHQTGFYDPQLESLDSVIHQFCIAINDAEQARRVVSDLGDKLHMDEITVALEAKQDKTSALKWRSSVEHLLDSCRSCMSGQMDMALARLIEHQQQSYGKNLFHMAWTPKGIEIETAMKPLLDQLDNDMSDFHKWMLHRNFVRYLNALFKCIMSLLDTTICENEGQAAEFHERLAEAVVILVDFFHAGGRGLSVESISEIAVYRKVNKSLKLHSTDTVVLIERYYKNLLKQQAELSECKYGILNVRVYFNAQADLLVVDVLSAKRIIPLDTNGLSDPFVIVELVPHRFFPQCPVTKTKVVPKTLSPVFEETFEFTVYESELPEFAMLHFVVMDHDFLRSNDFAGEAFVDLMDVPGFGESVNAHTALRQFNLILMHPENNDEEIVGVLQSRVDDDKAVDFCKHIQSVRYT